MLDIGLYKGCEGEKNIYGIRETDVNQETHPGSHDTPCLLHPICVMWSLYFF